MAVQEVYMYIFQQVLLAILLNIPWTVFILTFKNPTLYVYGSVVIFFPDRDSNLSGCPSHTSCWNNRSQVHLK